VCLFIRTGLSFFVSLPAVLTESYLEDAMEQTVTQRKRLRAAKCGHSARKPLPPHDLLAKLTTGELSIETLRQVDAVQLARNAALLTKDKSSWIVMASLEALRDYIKTAQSRGFTIEQICTLTY
jgi:hypothetical protein